MRRRTTAAIGGVALAGIAVVAAATLTFPTAPTALVTPTPIELPHELERVVFMACLPGLYAGSADAGSEPKGDGGGVVAEQGFLFSSDGSTGALSVRIESVGDWSVSVSSTGANMRSERSSDNPQRITAIADAVTPTARSLYNCMAPYRFAAHDELPARSSGQLLQQYRYDAAVLWPCLIAHGIDPGVLPSRDQFTASFLPVDPLSSMKLTRRTLPRLAAALQACPLRPAYLG
jgi:hypothetical protein